MYMYVQVWDRLCMFYNIIHTRTHAHTHPPTHTRTHAHMHPRMHARTHTHTHTHTHAQTSTHTHRVSANIAGPLFTPMATTCMCLSVCQSQCALCMCMCVCVCVCVCSFVGLSDVRQPKQKWTEKECMHTNQLMYTYSTCTCIHTCTLCMYMYIVGRMHHICTTIHVYIIHIEGIVNRLNTTMHWLWECLQLVQAHHYVCSIEYECLAVHVW